MTKAKLWWLDDRVISKTAAPVGCSQSVVVSIYEGPRRNSGEPAAGSCGAKAHWWRLARVVWPNRRATVAQQVATLTPCHQRRTREHPSWIMERPGLVSHVWCLIPGVFERDDAPCHEAETVQKQLLMLDWCKRIRRKQKTELLRNEIKACWCHSQAMRPNCFSN